MYLIFITLIVSCIIKSNAEISCANGNAANVSAGPFLIRSVLCADDDSLSMDIEYSAYSTNWFGIVASPNMGGSALIYTTGESDELSPALYAYTATIYPRSVTYNPDNNWIEVSTSTNNGIRVIYKQSLSKLPWTLLTTSIQLSYAYGSSLTLGYHGGFPHRNDKPSDMYLTFTPTPSIDSVSPTTSLPTTTTQSPGSKGCDKQNLKESTTILDEFTISLYINCDANTARITIQYSQYEPNNNWFGVVFSNNMIGDALIYTIGKSSETQREQGLYSYTNSDRKINDVTYDGSQYDWTNINTAHDNGIFMIEYEQDLDKSPFTRETENVIVKWAKGSDSLTLAYHSDTSNSAGHLDLLSGESVEIKDDISLEIAHGVLMWIAWCVLAPFGIMSSAFRFLYPNGPKWFFIHRGVQCCVVIVDIVAFIIAVVFTHNKGKAHFDNVHMILGLVVTIVCVLQPINALFRAHPPKTGWIDGVKSRKRIVWEYIHRKFGYIAWILGCIAAMIGMQILGKDVLSYIHMFLWCALLLVVYVVLFIIGYNTAKKQEQISNVNEAPGGGNINHESQDPMLPKSD